MSGYCWGLGSGSVRRGLSPWGVSGHWAGLACANDTIAWLFQHNYGQGSGRASIGKLTTTCNFPRSVPWSFHRGLWIKAWVTSLDLNCNNRIWQCFHRYFQYLLIIPARFIISNQVFLRFHLSLERIKGREKEKDRNIDAGEKQIGCLSHTQI